MNTALCARRVNGGKFMPNDWVPTKNDVVIGRGKRVFAHPGNEKLRRLVQQEVEAYSNAKNRAAKSVIIIRIFKAIRIDTEIGFVKKDPSSKKFYAVEDTAAKITIAQYFRDALADGYKSSKQYKQKLRDALKRSVSDVGSDSSPMQSTSLKRSASAGDSYHTAFPLNSDAKDCFQTQETPSYFMKMARNRCNPPVVRSILESASDLLEDGQDCEWPELDTEAEANVPISPATDLFGKETFAKLFMAFGISEDKTSNPFEPTPLKECFQPIVEKVESSSLFDMTFEDTSMTEV